MDMDVHERCNIHSVCRICMEHLTNRVSYDLFMIPGLAKKLCVCTSLSVEPHDGYPKNICTICYTRLNELHDFQKQCIDSVQKFQILLAKNAFDANAPILTKDDGMSPFDLLETSEVIEEEQVPTLNNEDDEPINFDPLLNHKMELIDNEEDVFKMLENVAKEATTAATTIITKSNNGKDYDQFIGNGTSYSTDDSDDDDDDDDDDGDGDFMPVSGGKRVHYAEDDNDENVAEYDDDDDDDDDDEDDDELPDALAINVKEEQIESDGDKPLAQRLRNRRRTPRKRYTGDDADEEEEAVSKFKVRTKKKTNDKLSNDKQLIECHICKKKFKKSERYQNHMKYHNDKLPHQCTVPSCLKGFTTSNGLRLHVEHCHAETIESYPCPEEGCGRTFPRTRLLNSHLKKVHKIMKELNEPKCYPCNECDKVFRCPMALKKHMYKHDGKELPFPCNICGKRFVINSALKDHLMRHAGIKNYVCPYCGVGKTTRQEWNTHINTHTQEKKFKCDLCPHASHNKQNLRMHVKVVHEKIKDHACQYCGKTFGKSNACKMHEMTHTGEKRCECKVCGRRFLYAKGLTKHLKTHEKRVLRAIEVYRKRQIEMGEISSDAPQISLPAIPEPVNHSSETHQKVAEEILKVCAESAAAIPKDPRRVERVDLAELAGTAVNPIPSVAVPSWSPQINFMMKEGPHICPDCGQGFNGPGNLKRHHRIVHEGVKDFACRFCLRRFAKAQTLKHHEMTHTGEKPHECKTCGKRFIQYVSLKRHMKVHQNRPPVIPASVYAAREELQLQERAKMEAKRKAQQQREAIAEAAKEQLIEMEQQQQELQKILITSNNDIIASYDTSSGIDSTLTAATTPATPATATTTTTGEIAINKQESNINQNASNNNNNNNATSLNLGDFQHINTSSMGIRTIGVNDQ